MPEETKANNVLPEFGDGKAIAGKQNGNRRRLVMIGAGVLMLMCICVAGLVLVSDGDDENHSPVAQ